MAKSIRSKWKRKCRAIKRERYAVKELARLKKMLGVKEDDKNNEVMDTATANQEEQVIFLDAGELKKKKKNKNKPKPAPVEEDVPMSSDEENIQVEGDNGRTRVFSTKTLKDQNGQYPVWLHKRKIAKMNKVGKKNTKKRSKKGDASIIAVLS